MPPSGIRHVVSNVQGALEAIVSTGTMVDHAHRDAKGTTGAPIVQSCTQGIPAANTLPTNFEFRPLPLRIISPINVQTLGELLRDYPCPGTRDYLISGFTHGFDIGFRGTFDDPNTRPPNPRSARENTAPKSCPAVTRQGPSRTLPSHIPTAHQLEPHQSQTARLGLSSTYRHLGVSQ